MGLEADEISRGTITVPTRPLHEVVNEDILENASALRVRLAEALAEDELPRSYHTHPLVLESEEPPLPIGIYVDGLPYSLSDGLWGCGQLIWFQAIGGWSPSSVNG